MGLEFGDITGVWLGREDGGWEPLEGVTRVELNVEGRPAERTPAHTDESGDRKLFSWVQTCPGGIHPQHPGSTCEEQEELSKAFQDFIERLFTAVYVQAARRYEEATARFLEGLDGWEPRGLLASLAEPVEPTPIERALQILEPYLAREPLYRPRPQMGHRMPDPVDARVPEQRRPALTSTNRPAWQSPYGPPPRRR
jgi:hypothetical protein